MKNFKIGVRLGVGFGLVVLLLIGITFLGATRMAMLSENTDVIVNTDVAKVGHAATLEGAYRANSTRYLELLIVTDKAEVTKILERVEANRKTANEANEKLDGLVKSPEGKAVVSKMKDGRTVYAVSYTKFLKAVAEGKREEAGQIAIAEMLPALHAFLGTIKDIEHFQAKILTKAVEHSHEIYSDARNLMLTLAGLAVLLAVMIAWWVTRSVTGPIREAMGVAEGLAKGDLTQKIEAKSKDETGQLLTALGNTVTQLKGIMGGIKESTETISTASSQIAQGNADLSQRTEEQASSLEETASSMEELTSTVKQNAENAKQAKQLAASASDVAVKGGHVVKQVVDTMSGISESSKKIADIIGVIDGIAFQTNILALNAAVEAARAGEQGRGFAVVASEVRNLAQRSAAAAKEIKALIGDSVEKVGAGTKLVDEAGKTMEEIVSSVKRVTDIMTEIAAASQEQSSGIEQVNQAVTQMDEVTQQNAALVEEAAAAAESMQEQAQSLAQAVSVFKLDHEAAGGMARVAAKREKPAPAAPMHTASVTHLAAKKKFAPAKPAAAQAPEQAFAPRAKKVAGGEEDWKEF